MANGILSAFLRFPNEENIIGAMLTAYGELEYDLCLCVAAGLYDLDTAVKIMFRTRGETQRIEVADALGRKAFDAMDLGTPFAEAIASTKFCLKLRNQYAHCNWHDDNTGRLCFLNLEEIAVPNAVIGDMSALTFKYLTVPLLTEQRDYFSYTSACLTYLNYEAQKRAGRISTHMKRAPKKAPRPPLDMP
jgi:hypothetical protein